MSDDIAIRVKGLGKKYTLGGPQEKYLTLRDALTHSVKSPFHRYINKNSAPSTNEFWALKDISFDVHKGEVIGIIGRNGAGKSTLLKILSRITTPSEGVVEINGRIGSLLEVGTGFHPELTGRENIFLSGSILGMKKREIDDKFDEIVKFSEIEKFLDTPVKRYSSGMYVRLAFAVAAHMETEILLIDEVLAVGDVQFQKKCLGKMGDVTKQGKTVIFVSHNMEAIRDICINGVFLNQGKIEKKGEISDTISVYLESFIDNKQSSRIFVPSLDIPITFNSALLLDQMGNNRNEFNIFENFFVELNYTVNNKISSGNIALELLLKNTVVFTTYDTDQNEDLLNMREPGCYLTKFSMPSEILKPGDYSIRIVSGQLGQGVIQDLGEVLFFRIHHKESNSNVKSYSESRRGIIACKGSWVVHKIE